MEKKIALKYGSTKFNGFFFLDDQFDFATKHEIDRDETIKVVPARISFEKFISKEYKDKVKKLLQDVKGNKNKNYIVEIWQPLNKAITKVDQIPDIEYYHKKVSKLFKYKNLIFIILNLDKKDGITFEKPQQEQVLFEEQNNKPTLAPQKPQPYSPQNQQEQHATLNFEEQSFEEFKIQEQKKFEEMRRLEEEEERRIQEERRKLQEEQRQIELEKAKIEQEKQEIEKQERILNQQLQQKAIQEEIKKISNENKQKVVEYTFDQEESHVPYNTSGNESEYDNIVWMNEENKDLFKLKKSVTKVIDINEIEDSHLNKAIMDSSDIDSTRLVTNQVKIDFDDESDTPSQQQKKRYVPYEKIR